MKEWYSEESHVKKFLNTMVEILFQKIPFSRRAEEAKQKISDSLFQMFEKETTEEKNSLTCLEQLMEKADTLEKAGILAGYTRADPADLQREDNLKNQKKLRKAIREYKRYILSETFLAVGIVLLGIVCVCNFSFSILLINVLWGAVFTGGILSFILPQLQKSLISVRSAGYLWQKQSND